MSLAFLPVMKNLRLNWLPTSGIKWVKSWKNCKNGACRLMKNIESLFQHRIPFRKKMFFFLVEGHWNVYGWKSYSGNRYTIWQLFEFFASFFLSSLKYMSSKMKASQKEAILSLWISVWNCSVNHIKLLVYHFEMSHSRNGFYGSLQSTAKHRYQPSNILWNDYKL